MVEVRMPKWGLTMEEGTIISWFKGRGEQVKKGEIIAEVEVDKSTGEIEAPASGELLDIKAFEGSEVSVGQILAIIKEY